MKNNLLSKIVAVIISFLIAYILSIFILFGWLSTTHWGFEGLIAIPLIVGFLLPPIAGVLAIPIYFIIIRRFTFIQLKSKKLKKLKYLAYGIAILFALYFILLAAYNAILYKYDPRLKQQKGAGQYSQLLSYSWGEKPWRLEEWRTYADSENNFAFKYPPVLEVKKQNESSKLYVFFRDSKHELSTNTHEGNELLIVNVVSQGTILPPCHFGKGTSIEKFNNISVRRENCRYIINLPNGNMLLVSGNEYINKKYKNAEISRELPAKMILETLTFTDIE